ncbi:MAG: LytR/AlgR family response regulator transcription factor [Salibacteraceae bacterium]
MNVYIVDDEPHAIRTIEALLERKKASYHNKVVGSSSNANEALNEINRLQPNVIFLDIEMPEMNGFELLNKITYDDFLVVFVTAYRDYAVEAFSVEAFQYIVKPISPLAFEQCLDKIIIRLEEKSDYEKKRTTDAPEGESTRLAFRAKEGYSLLQFEDIISVQSEGSYSNFILSSGKKVTQTKNLKYCESVLPNDQFMRISRYSIINLNKIKSFSFQDGGSITVSNSDELLIGKTYRSDVFKYLRSKFVK